MSREIVDAVIEYSRRQGVQIMLIASRNQIECEDLGGGYVDGLTTESLVDYVRHRGGEDVLICRDHAGPYMHDADRELPPGEALARAMFSIRRDIDAGFDLIHVDCCRYGAGTQGAKDQRTEVAESPGDRSSLSPCHLVTLSPSPVLDATIEVLENSMEYAARLGRTVLFEVGTEENVGRFTDPAKFESELEQICRFVRPEFVVGQTGSLVKETFQVGFFEYEQTRRLTDIAHAYGVKFKEHNADYITSAELRLRRSAGVDAVNVAPELGATQTRTVIALAQRFGLFRELRVFLECSNRSRRWSKWVYGEPLDGLRGVIAGHYVFGSEEYGRLVDRLRRLIDVDAAIRENVAAVIDRYVGGMR